MNIRLYTISVILLLSFCMVGCIDEYQAKGIDEVRGILVVEGTISEGECTFLLSSSVGLTDKFTDDHYVTSADVYIERSDGTRTASATFVEKGRYVVDNGTFSPGVSYRLHVRVGDDEYVSEYLEPLYTPVFDIELTKAGEGQTVYVCVNTSDPLDQSNYYRWTYKEDWEITAPLAANYGEWEIGGEIQYIDYSLLTEYNTYYCWEKDSSKVFFLESSNKLSENLIYRKRLVEIDPRHRKLSVLYYISVDQMLIRKEAYDYFSNLQKNIDETSSIFSPMPSEMRGNIKSVANPDKIVIGYIEVTTIQNKTKFTYPAEGFYEYNSMALACTDQLIEGYEPGYLYYIKQPAGSFQPDLMALPECVDCRRTGRATKRKPSFWPNNHL